MYNIYPWLKDMCKKYLAKLKQQDAALKVGSSKLENQEEEGYKAHIKNHLF